MTDDGGLTPSQVAAFHRDGYLIIPDALPPPTVAALLAETHRLLATLSLADHPLTRFRTGGASGRDHVGDAYFLTSGDQVRFFLEEAAFAPAGALLDPAAPPARLVNKIGHGLHLRSPPFARLLRPPDDDDDDAGGGNKGHRAHPARVARALGFRDPRCLQSMIICKQPGVGGAVPPHQDSSFLHTRPPSAVGFWYALEDATVQNGCLRFAPGSHRWAPVRTRLVRRRAGPGGDGEGTEMVENEGPGFPPGEQYGEDKRAGMGEDDEVEYVPGEVKAGSLVLIHGNLLHKSERNLSDKGRIIYTFHIIEWDGTEYDERNWLQPPKEGFTRLYTLEGVGP
ncbi:hypothetical protein P8C59_004571 [Phyllachora maydis]|uniref:Phytanoyl-CoA dioxygenase n=1 Tax=Phyllachora maydis TaxID=1825666 RepID=A0AAD9MBE7_9PEZI|nr:hypothetical protein P8C59_004571 [Phyllachora maydis]